MEYFNKAFLRFLKNLDENNNREWFHANKKSYEEDVKIPFENFIGLMIDNMQAIDPTIVITPKDAIFRIHRDVRFSKDKSPYKNHVSAIISKGGRKDMSTPGLYLQVSAKEFGIYSGAYMPDKNQLQGIREAIASDLSGFEKLINAKAFISKFGRIQGEKNKRIPKEFQEVAEQQALIANKQFYYIANLKADTVLETKLPKILMDHYQAALPLSKFLSEAMGV
ncbi:MAG: hypothetical protein ACI8P3_000594 [Saprospiraceae bacterium]|jgi:uncharacterized protein (TIGR02453 family)